MRTIKTYKLLRQKSDGLHPLFIDSAMVLPIGEWIEAQAPNDLALQYVGTGFALIDLTRQRPTLMQVRRPRPREVEQATANRCRWVEVTQTRQGRHVYDLGLGSNGQVMRFAHRPGWHTSAEPQLPGVKMEGKVWAECLIPADEYTIHRANVSGLTATREPPEWYISQRLLIERVICPSVNNS